MLFWFFAFLFGLLGLRLFKLQHLDHQRYLAMAEAQQKGQAQLPALRGEIRDRNNAVLATSLARWSVAADPSQLNDRLDNDENGSIDDVDDAVGKLSPVLSIKPDELRDTLRRSGTFAWLARKVSEDVAERVKEMKVEGVFLLREPTPGRRFYPKGRLAAHLLGATGIDDQGLDGLEAAYDEYLTGEPGLIQAFMDRDGWATLNQSAALIRPAEPGHSVVLTIDETIQYAAERELAKTVKEYKADGGCCIVMDAKTGEVLAMALQPDFPASEFANVKPAIRRNRAITDPYEPGSTFKIFLAAAALNAGVKPSDTFRAGGVLSIGGWTIHNASDGLYAGYAETLADIIAFSFNVGTASVAMQIGKKPFYQTLEAFGFGQQTGIDLVGESEGLLAHCNDWADINTATISFGQGVAVTPMQLVSGMQAVANGGIRMKPYVVKAIVDKDGNVVKRNVPTEKSRPMTPEKAAQLRDILVGVCEKGTGKRAKVEGFTVGGKTGTAQMAENGVYAAGQYVASFVGFAPADDPRLVILVKVDKPTPYWGGLVAGPVFSAVAEQALWKLGVRPSQTEKVAEGGQSE